MLFGVTEAFRVAPVSVTLVAALVVAVGSAGVLNDRIEAPVVDPCPLVADAWK